MGGGDNPPAARRGRTLLFAPGGVPGGTGRSGGTPPVPAPPLMTPSGHPPPPHPTHPAWAPPWRHLWPWRIWPRGGGGGVGGGDGGGGDGGGGGTSDAVGACATCTVGRCGGPEAIYWDPPTNQRAGHSQHAEKRKELKKENTTHKPKKEEEKETMKNTLLNQKTASDQGAKFTGFQSMRNSSIFSTIPLPAHLPKMAVYSSASKTK